MAERGKTIICSVLFLDIAEYSKKSVSGQISLKERFNAYLSVAIRDVPIDDRIILDTGDGAALSFLGDVGDALQVALSMRESLREGLHMEPPLLVRMGVNLGPVRLIRDINGQPNIVGDGINVAQRVMGFADPGQILVSRTYYDAVSRLSPEYAGMFHYQGSRTDKHVREHEIYAIGYPGEFTSTLTLGGEGGRAKSEAGLSRQLGKSWRSLVSGFRAAPPLRRIGYVGAALLPVVALVSAVMIWGGRKVVTPQDGEGIARPAVAPVVPASAVVAPVPASSVFAALSAPAAPPEAKAAPPKKPPKGKPKPKKGEPKKGEKEKPTTKPHEKAPAVAGESGVPGQGTLVVTCGDGATVFIDASPKGKVGKSPLMLRVDPGKHQVLVMYLSRVYSKKMDLAAGKVVKVSPDICRAPPKDAE